VRGHSNAEAYARNYKRYSDSMRAVDPTIRFIAVGDNDMEWNRTVLRRVGRYIDYLAIHHHTTAASPWRATSGFYRKGHQYMHLRAVSCA
jgi:hypothetical protein